MDSIHNYKCNFGSEDIVEELVFDNPFAIKPIMKKTADEKGNEISTPLWDDHHIRVEIDINGHIANAQLIDELRECIRNARYVANIQPKGMMTPHKNDMTTFKIYDLVSADKSPIEIIKEIWPDEYEKECGTSDLEKNKEFNKLREEYELKGKQDPYNMASEKVYGNDTEDGNSGGGRIKFYQRIIYNKNKMEDLLDLITNI